MQELIICTFLKQHHGIKLFWEKMLHLHVLKIALGAEFPADQYEILKK